MKCPVDNATLSMTERAGIEIDYCPECRGVWLDRGELDKLVKGDNEYNERREHDDRHRDNDHHDDDDDDEYQSRDRSRHSGDQHHKKKRGGFMENIFDGFGG